MTILPKSIYLFSAIPIKLPRYFFTELEKNYNKVHMENKRSRISTEIMKKNVKEGGLAVPDLKLYYKAVVIKTIWYWLRNRREDQWNRIGVRDLGKTVYDKPKESSFWDKMPLFEKKLLGKLENSMGETGSGSTFHTLYQDKFSMDE